jgi:hypothetical protein
MRKNYELRKQSTTIRSIHVVCVPLFILIFSFKVSAQDNFTITNYFTNRYRDFPMSKISIIPPAGFEKDTIQSGFIDRKNNASIRTLEIKKNVDSAFADFFIGLDSSGRQGKYKLGIINTLTGPIELLEVYDFTINGFSAHLLKIFEYTEGDKYFVWTLFVGDSARTYMINGFLPKRKQKELDQQIRTSLLSVFYEPDRRILPVGADATTTGSSACGCHSQK